MKRKSFEVRESLSLSLKKYKTQPDTSLINVGTMHGTSVNQNFGSTVIKRTMKL